MVDIAMFEDSSQPGKTFSIYVDDTITRLIIQVEVEGSNPVIMITKPSGQSCSSIYKALGQILREILNSFLRDYNLHFHLNWNLSIVIKYVQIMILFTLLFLHICCGFGHFYKKAHEILKGPLHRSKRESNTFYHMQCIKSNRIYKKKQASYVSTEEIVEMLKII